jgi:putative transposase
LRKVPARQAVSNVVEYLKRERAAQIARDWARSYFVSTVELDENIVRAYIRNQEDEDERYDQMKLEIG